MGGTNAGLPTLGGFRMIDSRIDWVSTAIAEAQQPSNRPSAVRILSEALTEWDGFANEFPRNDQDVARVGTLLRVTLNRFATNAIPAAYRSLAYAGHAIRKVAAR